MQFYLPSGHKTFLRHRQIVLKLSYLSETNCKCAHKCLGKTSNRRLIKISTSDVPKISFKGFFQTNFYKFLEKKLFTSIYLFLVFLSQSCHKVRFPTSLLRPKTNVFIKIVLSTSVFRPSVNVAAKPCFEVIFLMKL